MPDENEDEWITEMTHFLSIGPPPDHLTLDARKQLAVQSRYFYLVSDTLCHKGSNGIWHRAIRQFEKHAILQEAHQRGSLCWRVHGKKNMAEWVMVAYNEKRCS